MKATILYLVLASIAGMEHCSDESSAVTQEPEDKALQALLEARRDTLKEVLAIIKAQTDRGRGSIFDMTKMNTLLLEAELEAARTQQDAIESFERALEVQSEVEKTVRAIVEMGGRIGAGPSELFIATADRLKVEIDLYKAKKGNWRVSPNRSREMPAAVLWPGDEAVHALLKARRDTLRDAEQFIQTKVEGGVADSGDLVKAIIAFLEAELELTRSQEERIAIYETVVANEKEIEQKLNTSVEAGVGSRKELLTATAARINAEIQLHQARKATWPVMTESGRESSARAYEPEEMELQTLREARRDTLKEVVRLLDARFRTRMITANELLLAKTTLLGAELELAKSQHERIAILEQMLESQTEVERNVSEIVKDGRVPRTDLLIATAARMKAEIDLHKARKKAK